MDLTQLVTDYCGTYATLVLAAFGLFAALATLFPAPTETSGTVYRAIYGVLSWLACNFGHAKNASAGK